MTYYTHIMSRRPTLAIPITAALIISARIATPIVYVHKVVFRKFFELITLHWNLTAYLSTAVSVII